jgi:D-glycero-alpha-D-manno-heptose-7-phosphate kinase
MIISRTPFRISFFGGGTDYPAWVDKHGGAVLSTTFDKYSYITCRTLPPFFEHKHRIAYSVLEDVFDIDEIKHPAIRAVLKDYFDGSGFEVHCDSDLPARSGLGSSSAFVVGLVNVLEALKGRRISPEQLAKTAIRYEQDVLKENVGSQDQIATTFGGLNIIYFHQDRSFRVEPLVIPAKRRELLDSHLMLFFTGIARYASEIAKSQIENIESKTTELMRMRAMVDEAVGILSGGKDIRPFGELLHNAWLYKKSLSDKISTDEVDTIYEAARKAGALGGKLLGAGGGGFILFFVEPEKQDAVLGALKNLIHVPFHFESTGSQIVYYSE